MRGGRVRGPHLVNAAGVELEPSVDVEEGDAGPMRLEQLLRHRACSGWMGAENGLPPHLAYRQPSRT